ncbi:hypothetical protein PVAP13_3NG178327 [Panicum virgatum]|uniref:Uncharacterized protein n=1 Tax=Panicum virgatum TaxID=38727 RepID=A0A8T0TY49_PANVG|nr:hypothetical protein PVAP13_3NG178327 [Panicum virgatum]
MSLSPSATSSAPPASLLLRPPPTSPSAMSPGGFSSSAGQAGSDRRASSAILAARGHRADGSSLPPPPSSAPGPHGSGGLRGLEGAWTRPRNSVSAGPTRGQGAPGHRPWPPVRLPTAHAARLSSRLRVTRGPPPAALSPLPR